MTSSGENRSRRRVRITRCLTLLALLPAMVIVPFGCASADSSESEAPADATSSASIAATADTGVGDSIAPVDAGRVLVVFYSQGTTTRRVASDLAELTRADVEEIVDESGLSGYFRPGAFATFKRSTRIATPTHDPAEYDVVFVCTPVWSWSLSPPVRAWLVANRGELASAAFVTVSGDTKPDRIARDMARTGGVEPFAIVGFADRDFAPEGRAAYAAKLESLLAPLRPR